MSLATVQFSRSAKRHTQRAEALGPRPLSRRRGAGLSKLNSMRAAFVRRETSACNLPGPVDISSGRTHSRRAPRSSRAQGDDPAGVRCPGKGLPRKEVIQPQLPLRLPCYDFTPVASPTFDGSLQKVRPPASGVTHSHGVTGGVYKARERIHRGSADPRLLATPPSCRRVSACNPNRDAL